MQILQFSRAASVRQLHSLDQDAPVKYRLFLKHKDTSVT